MRLLITLLVALVLLMIPAEQAASHVLKTDGSIGVTIHINPDDAPVADAPSAIILTFQDKAGKLDAAPWECDCRIEVRKTGELIETLPISLSSTVATVGYMFPDGGSYNLEVIGEPRAAEAFSPFKVSFTYHVADGAGGVSGSRSERNVLMTYFPFVVMAAASFTVILFLYPNVSNKKERL